MHEKIRDFTFTGIVGDAGIVQTKESLSWELETMMREEGYVPVIDLEPQFTLDYIPHQEIFEFILTIYGSFVGKEKAWQTSGVTNGKMIPKAIPKTKSMQSCPTSE